MPAISKLGATSCVVALLAAAACSREQPPQRTAPADAKRVDAATAGNVSGRVALDGALPANAPIKLGGDPVCERAHKDGARLDTFVGENGGLGNVFVYVKDGLGQYYFDVPSEPVKLDQRGCVYTPHVFGVRVGQNVDFVNSDATAHTVHAVPNSNQEFNFSQPIQTQKDTRFFTVPEVMVRFKCDMHNWMSAYAGVLDHPYFAVTEPGGTFELKQVPPGTYTIEAWHEKLGTQTQRVTLADKGSAELTFTFKAAAATP
jgi:plastocyanin